MDWRLNGLALLCLRSRVGRIIPACCLGIKQGAVRWRTGEDEVREITNEGAAAKGKTCPIINPLIFRSNFGYIFHNT